MDPLSESDYIKMACINELTESGEFTLRDVLNRNGCANWTVCPACSVDDFSHTQDCRLRLCVIGLERPAEPYSPLMHETRHHDAISEVLLKIGKP
jgi:hypothetical protein